jgi:hypothetical protein
MPMPRCLSRQQHHTTELHPTSRHFARVRRLLPFHLLNVMSHQSLLLLQLITVLSKIDAKSRVSVSTHRRICQTLDLTRLSTPT